MKNIAFIGLGHMGIHMANNLIKAGFNVAGFDLNNKQLQQHSYNGGLATSNIKDACAKAEIVILSLASPKQVSSVCLDIDGVFKSARPGTIIIDTSIIDIENSILLATESKKHKLSMLDAPISGGEIGARNATLTFMVGGDKKDYNQVEKLFEVMGKKHFYLGGNGKGLGIKLINNMLLGVQMLAASEACIYAKALDLDLKSFYDVIATSTGTSWAFNSNFPLANIIKNVPANNDYAPGFGTQILMKDLNIAIEKARSNGLNLQLAELSKNYYEQMLGNDSLREKDFSAVIQLVNNKLDCNI